MRLLTAHRILIACAAAFFLYFALVELGSYRATGSPGDLAASVFGLAVAVGFAAYYVRRLRPR